MGTLQKDERKCYRGAYCGLCRRLGERYGLFSRLALSYDMTFLSMLLSSLYREEESSGFQRCPVNPFRRCSYVYSAAADYAADMSLMLSYYKCADDWHDDRNPLALMEYKILGKSMAQAELSCPRQGRVIRECLDRIGEMERVNEINPDLPANCFGELMAELFVWRDNDEWADTLRKMGAALGRFIYLMDAVMDFHGDIRKKRYNPLVAQTETDFTPFLTMLIGECTHEFEKLPLDRNVNILRNILYSGVWVRYRRKKEKASHD